MINQRTSGAQNSIVLFGGDPTKVTGADVARALADDLRLALQPMPLDQ